MIIIQVHPSFYITLLTIWYIIFTRHLCEHECAYVQIILILHVNFKYCWNIVSITFYLWTSCMVWRIDDLFPFKCLNHFIKVYWIVKLWWMYHGCLIINTQNCMWCLVLCGKPKVSRNMNWTCSTYLYTFSHFSTPWDEQAFGTSTILFHCYVIGTMCTLGSNNFLWGTCWTCLITFECQYLILFPISLP
jgi:hypothetical protein